MNQVSINTTATTTTTSRGYFNLSLNKDVIIDTFIITILYFFTKSAGFFFTVSLNGMSYEQIAGCPEDSVFNISLLPGDVVTVNIHHDDNKNYHKVVTYTVDEQGKVSSSAPKGVKVSLTEKTRTEKDIHSRNRPAA